MGNKNMDFVEMLKTIGEDKNLLEIFDSQCSIWWNKTNLIDIIKIIINKYFDKKSVVNNISVQIKMSIQSLIDEPVKLLELINNCLKPKDLEKKQFGEVFTPMILVDEMLDKLPKSVWKDKDLKWLDPATGMGNFPIAIYLRLMDGLSTVITDEKERKKHILENMIYMCELNKKNVNITKQIFDINNEYKLNLHEENSLKLDYKKTFDVEQFDIVVGNPPYQEANSSGDNKLYLDFTKKGIELLKTNGYLLYITPRNVLEYILLTEKNRKYLDKLYQINYINIETSNKYFPNIGSTFAYFLIRKIQYFEETTIEYLFQNKLSIIKIYLTIGYKIPKILTEIDIVILSKLISNTNNYVLNDFKFNKNTQRIRKSHITNNTVSILETEKHKIKIIDTINKTNPFPGKFYYYDKIDNDYNVNKLILSKKGYLMPTIDKTHLYTYTDNFKYIKDDCLDEIKLLLESNIVKYLLFQYVKNGFDSINIIKIIKKINILNMDTEDKLYEAYQITKKERKHIELLLKL